MCDDMVSFSCIQRRLTVVIWIFAVTSAQGSPATQPAENIGNSWQFAFGHSLPRWQDGLPIGNGRIGAQCWGDEQSIRLTIDRGDVWDLRYQANNHANYTYQHLRELVREKQFGKIQED